MMGVNRPQIPSHNDRNWINKCPGSAAHSLTCIVLTDFSGFSSDFHTRLNLFSHNKHGDGDKLVFKLPQSLNHPGKLVEMIAGSYEYSTMLPLCSRYQFELLVWM